MIAVRRIPTDMNDLHSQCANQYSIWRATKGKKHKLQQNMRRRRKNLSCKYPEETRWKCDEAFDR